MWCSDWISFLWWAGTGRGGGRLKCAADRHRDHLHFFYFVQLLWLLGVRLSTVGVYMAGTYWSAVATAFPCCGWGQRAAGCCRAGLTCWTHHLFQRRSEGTVVAHLWFSRKNEHRLISVRPLADTWGHMYEQWLSPVITFIFCPPFKWKNDMYEVHLQLFGYPNHVKSYSLFFWHLSSLAAR